ncbi:putative Phospholipase D3 [Hypsibius exemplaris]|uniref:Phospholipase D3 n=1 Tax=Hypsibius exemplaris TaxID=2072580 RepID=A0A1W0X5E0_HYPEX|nr:putative Phospholipase D3 [Hypsibius exemplaris]
MPSSSSSNSHPRTSSRDQAPEEEDEEEEDELEQPDGMESSWSVDYLDTLENEDTYEPVVMSGAALDLANYCAGSMMSENMAGCGGFMGRGASDREARSLACGPVIGLGRNRQTVLSSQNKADFTALELEAGQQPKGQGKEGGRKRRIEPWCFPVTIMAIFVALIIFLPFFNADEKGADAAKVKVQHVCSSLCRMSLVEALELSASTAHTETAVNINLPTLNESQTSGTLDILTVINSAQFSLDIAAPFSPLHQPSLVIVNALREAVSSSRNVKVRLLHPSTSPKLRPRFDPFSGILSAGSVRTLNVSRFLADSSEIPFYQQLGYGFNVHFWIIDREHFYLGPTSVFPSALSTGVLGRNCSCLAGDLMKLFLAYWYLSGLPFSQHATQAKVQFPSTTITDINSSNPMILLQKNDASPLPVFFAASPGFLSGAGRNDYLDSLLSVISQAGDYLYIHVADYDPAISIWPAGSPMDTNLKIHWPVIDNALRSAVVDRGVRLKMLVDQCGNERSSSSAAHHGLRTLTHLRSLTALNPSLPHPLEIKWFINTPRAIQAKLVRTAAGNLTKIPGQSKKDRSLSYVISDSGIHFGSNGWTGDQMLYSLGVSLSVSLGADHSSRQTAIGEQLLQQFHLHWASDNAVSLNRGPQR